MLHTDAEQMLTDFAHRTLIEGTTEAATGIYHVRGLGHSNPIVIEGRTSVILIDTPDSDVRGEALKETIRRNTPKPVKTIIYTHHHPDHRGGAAAFAETAEEVLAFAPTKPVLDRTEVLRDILWKRTTSQFGYELTDKELITQGLGRREGFTTGEGKYAFLPPTTVYHEKKIVREIDGITLELVAAPGETDDQLFVWLPAHNILCSGDTYYECWPNIYPLRGGQYRDVSAWIDSLQLILSYQPEILLPGHFGPIFGRDEIQRRLSLYKDALDYVLTETLAGMNRGLTADQLAETVTLPPEFASSPYLGEFYGTVAWTVRSIFAGYLGWFDGNPAKLNQAPAERLARELLAQIGDEEGLVVRIEALLARGDAQLALELSDILIYSEKKSTVAKELKGRCLLALAKLETSANGRHYYLACAKALQASR
ncbi:MAG: alkyl sulfatase dimerization domain-containing protein [Desulfopila sp.]